MSGAVLREDRRDLLENKAMKKNLDRLRVCLIGGTAGGARGYSVEHLTEKFLFATFGEKGITEYRPLNGMARFSEADRQSCGVV